MLTITVFAGVLPQSEDEMSLAASVGAVIGAAAATVRLGGYNGLMEEVSRSAAEAGARVVAPLLAGTEGWGDMNPYVDEVVSCATPGERIDFYLEADLIVVLPGGVGSLYELAAALWYTTSFGALPIWLMGHRCHALYELLERDRWIVDTPTRSTAHIAMLSTDHDLRERLFDFEATMMSIKRS